MEVRISNAENDKDGDILTMAFVNIQPLRKVYSPEKAFVRGTLFPEIDKPFLAGGKQV